MFAAVILSASAFFRRVSVALRRLDRPRTDGVEARQVRDELRSERARSALADVRRPLSLQRYVAVLVVD